MKTLCILSLISLLLAGCSQPEPDGKTTVPITGAYGYNFGEPLKKGETNDSMIVFDDSDSKRTPFHSIDVWANLSNQIFYIHCSASSDEDDRLIRRTLTEKYGEAEKRGDGDYYWYNGTRSIWFSTGKYGTSVRFTDRQLEAPVSAIDDAKKDKLKQELQKSL